MIKGLGTDLVEVGRIQKAMEKKRFLEKYFTENEKVLFEGRKMNPQTVAGNFAVKESVVKAFGTGFGKIRPIDIEVLRKPQGGPLVNLYGEAKTISESLEISSIHISISNTKDYATAFVVIE